MEAISPAAGRGVFGWLGTFIGRRPWVVIGTWVVLAVVLMLTTPTLNEVSQRHPVAILPSNAPSTAASRS